MAGEVALEQPRGVAAGLAFGEAAGDVVACCRVVLASVQDDCVEGSVELAVAAAAEPVPCCLAARGWEWCDAGEPGEAGLGVDAVVVGPGDDQLGGDDRADAGLSSSSGTSARTWLRISRSSVSASAVTVWMRRASVRSTRMVAS